MGIGRIFGVFDISGSGLSAQRKNLEVRAENLANAESVDSKTGKPYKRKQVRFISYDGRNSFGRLIHQAKLALLRHSDSQFQGFRSSLGGVDEMRGVGSEIVESAQQRTKLIYNPENPNANEDGYVQVPDIDTIGEMVDLMSAARAYEANATVLGAAKDMFKKALEI
ncbi:MAG: flagellar basal body rod protein FlgC [Calditrichaeota bacterium]|nr:flagellar basal body rod protein FlgC [Calditrichota bacterium]